MTVALILKLEEWVTEPAKKMTKKKAKKKKTSRRKTATPATPPASPPEVYKRPPPFLKNIFALDACHIPHHLNDVCLDVDDEFPLHYDTGIVRIVDDGNAFAEWLKPLGFQFNESHSTPQFPEPNFGWLAVWGT